jgi:polyhydroxyalkanoate synthesis regulator phasin
MVEHTCIRCGYKTNRKQNLKTHLTRKNLCKAINEDIGRYELLLKNGFNKEARKYISTTKIPQNNTKLSQNNAKKYTCEFCKKNYSRIDSLNRHKKNFCKEKNKIYDQVELLIKEMTIIKKDKQIEQLIKQLENVSSKPNINRGTINNANNQCNIIINNFGEEQIKYISDKTFKKLLSTPISAIPKLIELKHFNPAHPENHNIRITNIHDKYAKIYKDRKWLTQHKKDVIQELVDNGFADFEEFRDLNDEQITQKIREKYKKMEQNYSNNLEKLKEKTLITTINGSDKIIENDIEV